MRVIPGSVKVYPDGRGQFVGWVDEISTNGHSEWGCNTYCRVLEGKDGKLTLYFQDQVEG